MSTALDYYKELEDYEDIKKYLDINDDEEKNVKFDAPEFIPDFSSFIVVDNTPLVTEEKIEKLKTVLMKLFSRVASITENEIYMPFNKEINSTYGFCFVKYKTSIDAEAALKVFQNFAFTKTNTFKVSLYSDLDKYKNLKEEYVESQPLPFKPRPDTTTWLSDTKGRDQFVVRYAQETEICWANLNAEEPTKIYSGEREKAEGLKWCESYVNWSPKGTYLATFHPKGIKLWGSDSFEAYGRYVMNNVEFIEFSPCESYLITYRYDLPYDSKELESIIIWDVLSGTILKKFDLKHPLSANYQVQATISEAKGERVIRGRIVSYEEDNRGNGLFKISEGNTVHEDVPADKVIPLQDPNRLKWSHDGKYVARLGIDKLGCDIISIYSLPSMELLEKKSLKTQNALDFSWSPNSNIISYWCPANGNHPALINLVSLPDRKEVASRKLFDVTDGKMIWQNDGDYLCVTVTKSQGKKKTYVLMFFRVKESNIPVEQLELSEPITHIAWEPYGDRVCIIYGEHKLQNVVFYSMSGAPVSATIVPASKSNQQVKVKKELTLLFSLSNVQCTESVWSPAGGVIAIVYYASDSCLFEIHDVDNNIKLASRRHDRCNKLVWDPSGRIITTCTTISMRQNVKAQPDDGYNFYTFQGTPLIQMKKSKLYQFIWRPRPKDLLSSDEKKKIIKNLKKYEKIFDKEDRQRRQEIHKQLLLTRRTLAENFYNTINRNKELVKKLKKDRIALRNGYDSDDDRNYTIEILTDEQIVSTKEIIVQ